MITRRSAWRVRAFAFCHHAYEIAENHDSACKIAELVAGERIGQDSRPAFPGWPMIMANVPTFLVIVALIIGVVWAAFKWAYGAVLASKNGQIELLDRQLAALGKAGWRDPRRLFHGTWKRATAL